MIRARIASHRSTGNVSFHASLYSTSPQAIRKEPVGDHPPVVALMLHIVVVAGKRIRHIWCAAMCVVAFGAPGARGTFSMQPGTERT
jgi:hypothetical protein